MQNKKLNHESGRSLVEVVGVLAVGAMMIAGTFQVYQSVRARQARIIASEELRDIARNSRILFAGRNDYTGISVNYLIKMGALKTDAAPGIATDYSIQSEPDGGGFLINLSGVSFGDCAWVATQHFDWAAGVHANDFVEGNPAGNCKKGESNKVSILVK